MAHLFPNKDSTKCAGGSSPFVRKQGIVTLFTNNGIPRKHNAAIVQSPVHVASHLEDFFDFVINNVVVVVVDDDESHPTMPCVRPFTTLSRL